MIFNLAAEMLLLFSGLAIGGALCLKLGVLEEFDRPLDRVFISIWAGLLLICQALLLLSFLSPLASMISWAAAGFLLGISLRSEGNRGFLANILMSNTEYVAGSILVAAGAAAYCSQVIVWYDSGTYHIPAVKWLSEYGLVPGLALVYSHLGYPSSWFALAAPFNGGIFHDRAFSFTGGLCLTLLLIQDLAALAAIAEGRARKADWFFAAASSTAILLALALGMPNSPAADFPVIALIISASWAMLAARDEAQPGLAPLILAAGAAAIKLNALPLLCSAGLFYLLGPKASLKRMAMASAVSLAALGPIAAGSVLSSGCAFFPASAFCFDLPWSLGKAEAAALAAELKEWCRWGGPAPDGAERLNWVAAWVSSEKTAALLIALSLISAIWLALAPHRRKERGVLAVAALGFSGTAFLLYAAPTLRLALGYLLLLPALMAASHGPRLPVSFANPAPSRKYFLLMSTAASLFLALHIHILPRRSYRWMDQAIAAGNPAMIGNPHFNFFLPPKTLNVFYKEDPATGRVAASPVKLERRETGGFSYLLAVDGDQCWDAPQPCSPDPMEAVRLKTAGLGLRGGFIKTRTK